MMNKRTETQKRADEMLRFALQRTSALAAAPPAARTSVHWAVEAANLGDASTLAALALLSS